jgi:hypothetical protein
VRGGGVVVGVQDLPDFGTALAGRGVRIGDQAAPAGMLARAARGHQPLEEAGDGRQAPGVGGQLVEHRV